MRLLLASGSPRRREILDTLGISFEVLPSGSEDAIRADEAAESASRRLAKEKALEVATRAGDHPTAVLGADTVVVVDDRILGKPLDDEDAARMLTQLSGRWHRVVTGVALVSPSSGLLEDFAVSTRVRFLAMSELRIQRYVATGEGRDKAGAYAVQGIGSGLIDRIEGSYSNVVGLPAAETVALLERHGVLEAWP